MWSRKKKTPPSPEQNDFTQITLNELDLGFHSDVGAPCPAIISDELHLRLLFYIQPPRDPNWDGATIHIRDTTADNGVALLSFDLFNAYYFGMPNDEAISGHRYCRKGLQAYSQYEVLNSEWIQAQEKMNRVHPHHSPESFSAQRHFIFTFHDSCCEIIARKFSWEILDCSLKDALAKALLDMHRSTS